DSWSGRRAEPNADASDGPLASLRAARDAIRRARRADNRPVAIRVLVADGRYELDEPFVLEPQDSGTADAAVRYCAAPGAKPLFSGGRVIGNWQQRDDGLWQSDIPTVASGQWYFEQLWVDGSRAIRARSP